MFGLFPSTCSVSLSALHVSPFKKPNAFEYRVRFSKSPGLPQIESKYCLQAGGKPICRVNQSERQTGERCDRKHGAAQNPSRIAGTRQGRIQALGNELK
jgi:putative hemolysin